MHSQHKDTTVVERIQYSFVPNHRDTMEALAHARFSNQEYRVIISLMNQTNGYLREEDKLSLRYWGQLTGMSRQHVWHIIQQLLARNVLSRNGDFYKVNRPIEWLQETLKVLPEQATKLKRRGSPHKGKTVAQSGYNPLSSQVLPEQATGVAQPGYKVLPEQATVPDTNSDRPLENYKENLIKKTTSGGPRKKRGSTDHTVNEILAEMRSYLGYPERIDKDPIPTYGKEGQAIKRLFTRGFTREEILACWTSKVDQRGGEFISMTWVNEDIGVAGNLSTNALPARGRSSYGGDKGFREPGGYPGKARKYPVIEPIELDPDEAGDEKG